MKYLTLTDAPVDFILIPEKDDIFADELGCKFMFHPSCQNGETEELFTDLSTDIFRYLADEVSDFKFYINCYEEGGSVAVVDLVGFVEDYLNLHRAEASVLPKKYDSYEWNCYFTTLKMWGFVSE